MNFTPETEKFTIEHMTIFVRIFLGISKKEKSNNQIAQGKLYPKIVKT